MDQYFFRQRYGKNNPAAYLGTFFLLVTGVMGFGNLPLYIALFGKGLNAEEIDKITLEEIAVLLGKNLLFTVELFPLIIGLLMLLFAIRFIHRTPVRFYFTSRPQLDFKRFFTAFGITLLFLTIMFVLQFLTAGDQLVWNFDPSKFFPLLLIAIFLLPLQTAFEEVLFRGYLLQAFGRLRARGFVVLFINGVLFGALHFFNPEVFQLGYAVLAFYIGSGIFTALLALMDDGIELSWGFHTANNMLLVLLVTNNWQALQTDALFLDHSKPALGIEMILELLIFYPGLIFLFSRIYKWKDWKKRLWESPKL